MKTTYQYKFYPDTNQKLALNEWLRICRYWYNRQLGDRFDWWEMNRTSVNACPLVTSIASVREKPNYYSQKQQLPIIKILTEDTRLFLFIQDITKQSAKTTTTTDIPNHLSCYAFFEVSKSIEWLDSFH